MPEFVESVIFQLAFCIDTICAKWHNFDMELKESIELALKRTGWKPTKLAAVTDVPQSVISRLLNGKRKGVHSDTYLKLKPYLEVEDE